ncbi:MAG: hypothetical protein NVS2B5_05810 [Beijerinckiaceae bacterium]
MAYAQDIPDDQHKAFLQKQFRDWDGIAFYCDLNPEDEASKSLCEWTWQRLRIAATPLNISVIRTNADAYTRGMQQALMRKHPIELRLKYFGTRGLPAGFYVNLSARSHYSDAIENGVSKSDPHASPKTGTMEFWSREFIGAREQRDAEMSTVIRQHLETILMDFLADFSGH